MCMYYPVTVEAKKAVRNSNKEEKIRNSTINNMIRYMSDFVPFAYEQWEKSMFSRIMFYRNEARKKYVGYCECGAEIKLTKARSGRIIVCPECNKQVRLTKSKYDAITQEDYFALLQRAEGGWIQRLFVTHKESYLEDGKVYTNIKRIEEERDYFDGDNIRFFHPVYGGDGRWLPGGGRKHGMSWTGWRICDKPLHNYPENLDKLFAESKYRYSALKIAAEHSLVNPFYYLHEYDKEPRLEMIYKLGLYTVGRQLLSGGFGGDEPKRLMREIISLKDLGIHSKKDLVECRDMTVQEIIARKEVKMWNLSKDEPLAIAFTVKLNARSGTDFNYSFMSRKKWFKYYLTQRDWYNEVSVFIRDYADYISDCIALKYDLTDLQVICPNNLTDAHARSIMARKYVEAKKNKKDFCIQIQKWLKAGYSDGVFNIAVIPDPETLVKEAQAMHNCSAGYVGRIAAGNCSLWTIRRCDAPDEAFYMLELSKNGKVVQCRGVATNSGYGGQPSATNEVKAFVNKWLLKKVITLLNKHKSKQAI